MKFKSDFVTNSSSTSFVAFCVPIEKVGLNMDEYYRNGTISINFDAKYVQPYDECYIGLSFYTLMKKHPDLRLCEIRAFVAAELNKCFDTDFTEDQIGYIEEGWYDG